MPLDATRRIGTARLTGRSASVIARGARVLDEALRTASLPQADAGRLLCIRTLSLGVIHADRPAGRLSQHLQQTIAAWSRLAVHGADPRAASAPAVYFHDRLDAVVSLAAQVARPDRGPGLEAWYWRQAVPGWTRGLSSDHAGRLLLATLLELPHPAQALAQAFPRLMASHSLTIVLRTLRESDGTRLLARCGWSALQVARDGLTASRPATSQAIFPRAWGVVLTPWVEQWGGSDPRTLWLVAWAVHSWRGEDVGALELVADVRHYLLRHTDFAGGIECEVVPVVVPVSERQAEPRDSFAEPVFTQNAGFWFLIPLLLRAGFGRALAEHPEWVDDGVPRQLLETWAERLSIPPDDPVRQWLTGDRANETEGSHQQGGVPARWDEDTMVRGWRCAARRWCRVQAGLGPATLVRRPGWVAWDRTHVAVTLPLSGVDLRIRRAGLDLDPGWVPWLGRVVRFHYDAERS